MENFEMEALAAGRHNTFLPVTFLNETGGKTMYYEYGEYRNICDEEWEHPYIFMDILEKILLKIGEGEKHLLFWGGYVLNKEYIYVVEGGKEIFIKYVPRSPEARARLREEGQAEFRNTFLRFIENLKITNPVTSEYAGILCKELRESRISRKSLLNKIFDLKREIHHCGWGYQ